MESGAKERVESKEIRPRRAFRRAKGGEYAKVLFLARNNDALIFYAICLFLTALKRRFQIYKIYIYTSSTRSAIGVQFIHFSQILVCSAARIRP